MTVRPAGVVTITCPRSPMPPSRVLAPRRSTKLACEPSRQDGSPGRPSWRARSSAACPTTTSTVVPRVPMVADGVVSSIRSGAIAPTPPETKRKKPCVAVAAISPADRSGS